MDLLPGLRTSLALLIAGADDPQVDLRVELSLLDRYVLDAIPSGLGLTVTLSLPHNDFTVTTTQSSGPRPAASLRLPLAAGVPGGACGEIVFFAAAPGAFADLAADAQWLHHLGGEVVVDAHLEKLTAGPPHSNATETSEVNQAMGVLIERGDIPAAAALELQRLADLAGIALPEAAHRLLTSLPGAADRRPS